MSHQDKDSGLPSSSNGPDFSSLPRGVIGRRGLPALRNARLPSFRSPRDLTLGGAAKTLGIGGPAKKTIVPNIPVRREKSDQPKVPSHLEKSSLNIPTGRNDVRGSRGRGGDRNRNRPDLIQSQGGVFSERSSEAPKKNSSYSAYSSQREKSGSSSKTALTSVKKEVVENCNESLLNDIMRDDFIDDGEDDTDGFLPVILPLCAKREPQDSKNDVAHINGGKMQAKTDLTDSSMHDSNQENATVAAVEPTTAYQLFTNSDDEDGGDLFLFQFPDCIGLSPRLEESATARNDAGKSRQLANGHIAQGSESNGTSLDQLPEGMLGKLQIMKSGKTRLVLGSTILDVEMGTQIGCLQDLMSIETNVNSGDMTLLGHVRHKLICMPSVDNLLSHCSL